MARFLLNQNYVYICCMENEFRKDYAKFGVICSLFRAVPVIAMTATASKLT